MPKTAVALFKNPGLAENAVREIENLCGKQFDAYQNYRNFCKRAGAVDRRLSYTSVDPGFLASQ